MDAQTLTVLIMGGVVVALGFIGSYMAGLQKEREDREHDARKGQWVD